VVQQAVGVVAEQLLEAGGCHLGGGHSCSCSVVAVGGRT
jgi:hypothetical protein